MAEPHPYTFKIEPDPMRELRYRWSVCEGELVHRRSAHSYATRREAEADAVKAVQRQAESWKNHSRAAS